MNKELEQKILQILSDGEIHTERELSQKLNVSSKTICRHIGEMKKEYSITTFKGGNEKGGLYIDKKYFNVENLLTCKEKNLISTSLLLYLVSHFSFNNICNVMRIIEKINS